MSADTDKLIAELRSGRFATWTEALDWCNRAADRIASLEAERDDARRQRDEIGRAWDEADARAKEAEARAARLEKALAEAREALVPFGREAREEDGKDREDWKHAPDNELLISFCDLTYGDFRRAAALSSSKQKDGE